MPDTPPRSPLAGLKIIEMAGIGPTPFAAMMLADHGAQVIQINRPAPPSSYSDPVNRSRRSIVIDLKQPEGVKAVLTLARDADGWIEGLRPGVMERLGLGPDVLHACNPRIVYGRMTGWGQSGPLAHAAGHDLAYLAISGALHSMGRAGEKPPVPLNLVGDYGAGGMMLAFGMVSALLAAQRTGRGQVIDAAISDGAALLMTMFYSSGGRIDWQAPRGSHMLTGAAPFYDTYETADGGYIAIAAIEPQFHALLLNRLGLADDVDFIDQMDQSRWPSAKIKLTQLFRTRSRDAWCALLEGTDACFAPVLSMAEAAGHPHNRARGTFLRASGMIQPAPAPRFSEAPIPAPQIPSRGEDTDALLRESGYSIQQIEDLREAGVIGDAPAAHYGASSVTARP